MLKSEKDCRTQKSTLLMKRTLLSFLEDRPLHSVRVSELCKSCGINRATFYAHYCDIYDLVDAIENDIIAELNEIMAVPNPPLLTSAEIAKRFFSYLYRHRTPLRLLLMTDNRLDFANRLNQILTGILKQTVYEQYEIPKGVSQKEMDDVLGFVVFGHYSYYTRFIFDSAPLSEEEITNAAKLFSDLSECCLRQYFQMKSKS